jgi:predicted  nucleic acid-binding Zn-ribbon protein
MVQDLALALRLQALDRKIAALETEIATLPKHIAEIEKRLESHKRRLEADRAALGANSRDRKKMEIAYIEGEVTKCEDKIIVLMEQSEPLDKAVKAAEISLKTEAKDVEAEQVSARERTAIDQKESAELKAERKGIAEQMQPKLYTEYERVRKKTKNTPIADATDGRCSACQIALRPQFFQDLRKQDQVMFCESCSRLLTYNPVIDVAADTAATQQLA